MAVLACKLNQSHIQSNNTSKIYNKNKQNQTKTIKQGEIQGSCGFGKLLPQKALGIRRIALS